MKHWLHPGSGSLSASLSMSNDRCKDSTSVFGTLTGIWGTHTLIRKNRGFPPFLEPQPGVPLADRRLIIDNEGTETHLRSLQQR